LAVIARTQLYMFRAVTMPIIRSNITAKAVVGITYECGLVKCSVCKALPEATLLMMGMVNARNM
jgi:hypothetical protein